MSRVPYFVQWFSSTSRQPFIDSTVKNMTNIPPKYLDLLDVPVNSALFCNEFRLDEKEFRGDVVIECQTRRLLRDELAIWTRHDRVLA